MGDIENLVKLKVYIFQLGEMKADWDSKGALTISQKAIRNALSAIDVLDENDILPSSITPTENGGIRFNFERRYGEDVFEFSKDGKMGYISRYIYGENLVNGEFEHFETLFDRFLIDRGRNVF